MMSAWCGGSSARVINRPAKESAVTALRLLFIRCSFKHLQPLSRVTAIWACARTCLSQPCDPKCYGVAECRVSQRPRPAAAMPAQRGAARRCTFCRSTRCCRIASRRGCSGQDRRDRASSSSPRTWLRRRSQSRVRILLQRRLRAGRKPAAFEAWLSHAWQCGRAMAFLLTQHEQHQFCKTALEHRGC